MAVSIPASLLRPWSEDWGARREHIDRDTAQVRAIARWMDRWKIDPLLGLVLPGVGDIVSAVIGLHVVRLAWRHRLPAPVIARMLFNLTVDMGLGAIPLVGDLFDLGHRAHLRNAELFVESAEGAPPSIRDHLLVAGAVLVLAATLVLPILVVIKLFSLG